MKPEQRWLDSRLEHLAGRPTAQARLLLCSDDYSLVWHKVAERGGEVERIYWAEFSPYGKGGDFSLANEAATHLLQHDRPLTALALLGLYVGRTDTELAPSAELVARGLEALLHLPKEHQDKSQLPSGYDIQRLLDYLRSSGMDEDRLATLEWQFLPARGFEERSPVLERRLARDPEFFVEILSLCFRRKDGIIEQQVDDAVASNAYRLLREWKILPGSDVEGGDVDETALTVWVTTARARAAQRDRIDICDVHIGEVFAHARQDADGTWPTAPVRNMIEILANEKIESGFITGTFNKQGVTTRSSMDGGKQEYALANRFDEWAKLIADRWHRTAAALRSLAEGYRADGRREDEGAERYKRGLDD